MALLLFSTRNARIPTKEVAGGSKAWIARHNVRIRQQIRREISIEKNEPKACDGDFPFP